MEPITLGVPELDGECDVMEPSSADALLQASQDCRSHLLFSKIRREQQSVDYKQAISPPESLLQVDWFHSNVGLPLSQIGPVGEQPPEIGVTFFSR